MATKYTLFFSDTNKTPFDLQSYTTNGPESPSDSSIIAGATTASTTLKLWGKGLKEYGEPVFQDLIYMLENFADNTRPVFPIEGQLWYKNTASSELLIRNSNSDDTAAGSPTVSLGWDAVILATGTSAMTGELILSGNLSPSSDINAAAPKQYVDSTTASAVHDHVTTDVTDITATFTEINSLVGIGSPVQTQFDNIQTDLDNKVSIITDTLMNDTINLTFALGGEILGLPNSPSVFNAAASRQYVDDQVTLGVVAAGDGVLTSTEWLNNGLGSPLPDVFETTLRLTVSLPGSPAPTVTFDAKGISRSGHTHAAIDTGIDNSFDVAYGTNVQSAIEKAADEIELLKTGGVPPSATITVERIFEILATPLTVAGSPPDVFGTQTHLADDNRISLSINGVKQYSHVRGTQAINYISVSDSTPTGLDTSQTYEFAIAIDGGIETTVTVTQGSSPFVDITTHGALVTSINNELQLLGLDAEFSIETINNEIFKSYTSGAGSSIAITDPGGSPNLYLFEPSGSPLGLDGFIEVAAAVDGIVGDYLETDINGNPVSPSSFTGYVVFNYDIITGSKIESLLYV